MLSSDGSWKADKGFPPLVLACALALVLAFCELLLALLALLEAAAAACDDVDCGGAKMSNNGELFRLLLLTLSFFSQIRPETRRSTQSPLPPAVLELLLAAGLVFPAPPTSIGIPD